MLRFFGRLDEKATKPVTNVLDGVSTSVWNHWMFFTRCRVESSRICGDETVYFKPKHDLLPNHDQVVFVPNQSTGFIRAQAQCCHELQHRKIKVQHIRGLYVANIYSADSVGSLVLLNGILFSTRAEEDADWAQRKVQLKHLITE